MKSKFSIIIKYLKPHKKELLLGAVALVVVNLFSVLIPIEVRNIIDELEVSFSFGYLLKQSILIACLATLMAIIRLISRQLVFGVGRKIEVRLRQKIFDHLLVQDPDWAQTTGSGEIISRATSDVENIRRLLGFTILSLTNTCLAYSLTIPAMFSIDRILTLSSLLIFPLILGTVGLFGSKMVSQRKSQQEALSRLSEIIQEDLNGISAIKIYGQEISEGYAFDELNKKYRDSAIRLAKTASTLFPLLQGISSISLLLLITLGSVKLSNDSITIGELVALILYVERLVFPTALLGFTLNTFQLGQVSLDRVEEIINNEPKIYDKPSNISLTKPIKGKIEARNLTVKFISRVEPTLKGLSFTINPGELVAIVGPVGCGKTTLAKSLGRTIEIKEGQLFLDDIDITKLKLSELRKNIAIVPQESFLFTSTISDNIKFGVPEASDKDVMKAAIKSELINDINGFPDKFKTIVGERGITLSGGQRQRTALGRALIINTKVLVLDDALASVDNETASRIISSIRENTNKTILMISHQLSAAAACDRVIVIKDGKLNQQGTHKVLIKEEGLYRKLWEREKAEKKIQTI